MQVLSTLASEIPHEILTLIVRLVVDDSDRKISDMERTSAMDLPDDYSGEEGDLEETVRAIVQCPPAFINTLGRAGHGGKQQKTSK
ncbi:hypothetical protein K523DRAFT_358379 [Schizophyllum commune Tattone D]|nr:hypothetical protein K523DRAFT_358379 [Schizophyllum commune Tattone D]